ncbi:hypothetical protein GCM10010168_43790 [Actinoplanes ianthinogenes]|uniref:Uncharacterized protein n=1 Tax=Actinoplanes ianthinogenes TaxID=122358 RepID=A0ABN6CCR2_9ACTN|nr:hypothetical protein Aiant_39690 [Actinoplanes ianthinogenes]GGR20980.1 hypothetical protein GCM10010168_43790 [Actinoplanes ianthinogenes]
MRTESKKPAPLRGGNPFGALDIMMSPVAERVIDGTSADSVRSAGTPETATAGAVVGAVQAGSSPLPR